MNDDDVDLEDDDVDDSFEGAGEIESAKGRHPSRVRASWERPTRIAVASLAVVAIMFLFVFPTRSYLAQHRQVSSARQAVAALKVQNEQLAKEAKRLQTPSEIERLAREQFNMVLPGEQAYTVLSSAPPSNPKPSNP